MLPIPGQGGYSLIANHRIRAIENKKKSDPEMELVLLDSTFIPGDKVRCDLGKISEHYNVFAYSNFGTVVAGKSGDIFMSADYVPSNNHYLLKIDSKSGVVQEQQVQFENELIRRMFQEVDEDGNLNIIAICTNKDHYEYNGIMYIQFNPSDLKIINEEVFRLDNEFLFKDMDEFDVKLFVSSKDFWNDFRLLDFSIHQGRLYIALERHGRNTSLKVNGIYYDLGLLIACFDPQEGLIWKRSVQKRMQTEISSAHGSLGSCGLINNGVTQVLSIGKQKDFNSYTGPKLKKLQLFCTSVDSEGTVKIKSLGEVTSKRYIPILSSAKNNGNVTAFYSDAKGPKKANIWRLAYE